MRAKRSKVYRGQSARINEQENRHGLDAPAAPVTALCNGLLTIRLEGPQGCGKSLVRKVLAGVLGLLPLDTFVIVEKETE